MSEILTIKFINGWRLFWLISGPVSIAMLIGMTRVDLASGEGVSAMIQLSVRCAVPLLYLAFAASAIQVLCPGNWGRWLLRNRKYIGLCFAAAMAWQGFFILWLTIVHSDYYVNEVYVLRDAIEGVIGYLFLAAMTLTTFAFGRKLLTSKGWRRLHLGGIWFLWAYAFSVYWWNLFYYDNPVSLDYLYYWGGFLACGLRIASWRKRRVNNQTHPALILLGLVIVVLGLFSGYTDAVWRMPVEALTTGHSITRWAELYLPYYPPTPYVPLFIVAIGAWLTTVSLCKTEPSPRHS